MGEVTSFTCDGKGCGNTKRDTNHWWAVRSNEGKIPSIKFLPFERRRKGDRLVCGQACASNELSDFMGAAQRLDTTA